MIGHPLGHRLTVTLEAAELRQFDTHIPRIIFNDRTGRDLGLMNIQSHDSLVQCHQFHRSFLLHEMSNG